MRSHFTLAAAMATLALMAVSTPAEAECRLSLQPVTDQWRIDFDPFAQDAAQKSFDIAIVNQGTSPCVGRLEIDLRGEALGLSRPGQAQRIGYALIDERGGVDLTPRAGKTTRSLNARPLSLAPGEQTLERLNFASTPGDLVSAGTYSQNATVSVVTNDGEVLAQRPLALTVNVISAAVMGLQGQFQRANGVAQIDLGELTPGQRRLNTSLFVLSTSGYAVTVTSAGQGQLRHGSGGWQIGYALAVGKTMVDLAGAGVVDRSERRPHFDTYPLSITIGDTEGRRAGEYSDTLTFTIAAL